MDSAFVHSTKICRSVLPSREAGKSHSCYFYYTLSQSPSVPGRQSCGVQPLGQLNLYPEDIAVSSWENLWRQLVQTSSLVIVRNSPGDAVFPVMVSTPISSALPIFPLVVIQYLISPGTTSMRAIRGSFASPLWTPSFKSPNQADVLQMPRGWKCAKQTTTKHTQKTSISWSFPGLE